MWNDTYRQQARYNQWANERVYASVEQVGEGPRKARRNIFGGSIDGVLHHLLIADGLTMATLTNDMLGFRPRNRLGEEILLESTVQCLYPVFEELSTARVHLDRQLVDYAETLSESELEDLLAYFDFNGERHRALRWQLMTELFQHQSHHRGQLSTVLYELGQPLKNLDYSAFLRETA